MVEEAEIKGSLHLYEVGNPNLLVDVMAENGIQLSMYNCKGSWSDEQTHMGFKEFLSRYRKEKGAILVKVEGEVKLHFEQLNK